MNDIENSVVDNQFRIYHNLSNQTLIKINIDSSTCTKYYEILLAARLRLGDNLKFACGFKFKTETHLCASMFGNLFRILSQNCFVVMRNWLNHGQVNIWFIQFNQLKLSRKNSESWNFLVLLFCVLSLSMYFNFIKWFHSMEM